MSEKDQMTMIVNYMYTDRTAGLLSPPSFEEEEGGASYASWGHVRSHWLSTTSCQVDMVNFVLILDKDVRGIRRWLTFDTYDIIDVLVLPSLLLVRVA